MGGKGYSRVRRGGGSRQVFMEGGSRKVKKRAKGVNGVKCPKVGGG